MIRDRVSRVLRRSKPPLKKPSGSIATLGLEELKDQVPHGVGCEGRDLGRVSPAPWGRDVAPQGQAGKLWDGYRGRAGGQEGTPLMLPSLQSPCETLGRHVEGAYNAGILPNHHHRHHYPHQGVFEDFAC